MFHLVSILWFGRTQVIPEYVVFYKEVGILLGGLSDWWHYLMEHICRNATNYFKYLMGRYKWAPRGVCMLLLIPPHSSCSGSSCISINPVYSTSSVT